MFHLGGRTFYLLLGLLLTTCGIISASEQELKNSFADSYLSKYGYMIPKLILNEDEMLTVRKQAIQNFQWFAGINITGELDQETVELMKLPRCGVIEDINISAYLRRRKKRYILQGNKWPIRQLNYKITKFTQDLSDSEVTSEIDAAFNMWSEQANISFKRVSANSRSHFDVRFEVDAHGDNYRFDGPGGTLGHAFYPSSGKVHFDDDETWVIGDKKGMDLIFTATHEIGHALGLGHSNDRKSIMYSMYLGYNGRVKLNQDDIDGIRALYGNKVPDKNVVVPTIPSKDVAEKAPNLCTGASFDAITFAPDKMLYGFKGDFMWILNDMSFDIVQPQKISNMWTQLPGNLDAALTWTDKTIYFFKGNQVWRYRADKQLIKGYPKLIVNEFGLTVSNIDAAFIWSGNGKTYFVKDKSYWRYDYTSYPHIPPRYPQKMSMWKGLPDHIDDAFSWKDRRTYFFSGNNYYRLKNRGVEVEQGFPKSVRIRWLGCEKGGFKTPEDYENMNITKEDMEDDKTMNLADCVIVTKESSAHSYQNLNLSLLISFIISALLAVQ